MGSAVAGDELGAVGDVNEEVEDNGVIGDADDGGVLQSAYRCTCWRGCVKKRSVEGQADGSLLESTLGTVLAAIKVLSIQWCGVCRCRQRP